MTTALQPRRHGDPIGAHAETDVPTVAAGTTCGAARRAMAGRRYGNAEAVAVLDGRRLVAACPIEALIGAADDRLVEDADGATALVVGGDADREHVAWRAAQDGAAPVAVVDAGGTFCGLVPRGDLLGVLLAEHEEQLRRMAGSPSGGATARDAAEEPLAQRLRHRLPWLLVGLLGAMATALLVGAFEHRLEQHVLLAVFVPAVVYMSDAVGTQTEVLVIRGLSVGVDLRAVLRKELLTGTAIGLAVAAGFLAFALVVWGDAHIAGAVAISLWAGCSIATVVAMALPWGLHRLGQDPAFGSGPVATVVQDLLSIAVYFGVASVLV